MEPLEFELLQQHEPEEAQLFIKYAESVNGEDFLLCFFLTPQSRFLVFALDLTYKMLENSFFLKVS